MIKNKKTQLIATTVMLALLIFSGCERDITGLPLAPYPDDPDVFIDAFGPGINYQAFENSYYEAIAIDHDVVYEGISSMSFEVPAENDPRGWFAGGALVNPIGRDLSEYDALTFWVKASMPADLGTVGFGNDNTGNSRYTVEMSNIRINTIWKKIIIPIPLASKLTREGGMFHISAGHSDGDGFMIWLDDIKFEHLGTIAQPRANIPTRTITAEVGDSLTSFSGASVIMNVAGEDVSVSMSSNYLTFESSNDTVVAVDSLGIIRLLGAGTATLSAKLGAVDATGTITIISTPPPPEPETPAPTPTDAENDVISLFSDEYSTDIPIDTWSAEWDVADVEDYIIGSDTLKKYFNLVYGGILFETNTVDASEMTHIHLDVWTPNTLSFSTLFKIKLVDFGANGVYDGGDDSEHELTFSSFTNPALVSQGWISFDIPLSNFTGLGGTSHLAQLVISGGLDIVYVDNIYFHK